MSPEQRDKLIHGSSKVEHSNRAARTFARLWKRAMPDQSYEEIRDLVNKFKLNTVEFDVVAYKMSFVLEYNEDFLALIGTP